MKVLHKGFTFGEVAIALFIVASVLTSIIGLQTTVFQGITTLSSRLYRVYSIKNRLFESEKQRLLDQWKPNFKEHESAVANPETNIIYVVKKPGKGSSLASVKNLVLEQVTARWENNEQIMVHCVYYQEPKA